MGCFYSVEKSQPFVVGANENSVHVHLQTLKSKVPSYGGKQTIADLTDQMFEKNDEALRNRLSDIENSQRYLKMDILKVLGVDIFLCEKFADLDTRVVNVESAHMWIFNLLYTHSEDTIRGYSFYLQIYDKFLVELKSYRTEHKVIRYVEKTPVTLYTTNNGLFEALFRAYENHAGILLRPNDLWVQVLYDFSMYVDANPEEVRHVFVSHDDKKELVVEVSTLETDDDLFKMIALFRSSIRENLECDVPLSVEFESSDTFDRAIQHSMEMNTFKHYFEFKCEISCGITEVYFEGPDRDWELLLSRFDELHAFVRTHFSTSRRSSEFLRYLEKVSTIYRKFLETRRGQIDLNWWNALYSTQTFANGYSVNVVRDGWIFDLFLYADKDDMQIPQARSKVDVTIAGKKCTLYSGCDGFTFEEKSKSHELMNGFYQPHNSILIV